MAWATLAFVVSFVAAYRIYVWTQPSHHDLSDIGTGLIGLVVGVIAGLVAASIALALTRKRPQ